MTSLLFALLGNSDALRRFEHLGYDLSIYLSLNNAASKQVVIVAIDDAAIERYGPWPWSRDTLAAAQRQINAAKPKVVAYTLPFEAAHNVRGLEIMGQFRDANSNLMNSQLTRRFQQALNRLDSDHMLAMSFRNSNVLLGLQYQLGSAENEIPARLKPQLVAKSTDDFAGLFANWATVFRPPDIEPAKRFYLPIAKIGNEAIAWAAGDGYLNGIDGPRSVPLIVQIKDQYLPSLPLLVSAKVQNLNLKNVALQMGKGIKIDQRKIATDNAGRVYPYFYKNDGDTPPFAVYSINDILANKVAKNTFRNKAVLVGMTASRYAKTHATPLGQMSSVELLAHATSSLLLGNWYRPTHWSYLLRYAGILLVGLYLMLLLPRLNLSTGLASSILIGVLLLNVEIILMLTQAVWTPMMLAIAALIAGNILIEINRVLHARVHQYKEALTESNLQLARSLQSQGHLDQAFAKYKNCVINSEVLHEIYSLAEDYERKRKFKKASEVFTYIYQHRRRYRDVEARIVKNEQLDNTVLLGGDNRHSNTQTLILTDNGVKKPVLGRYEIEKEIGRGAMGTVYLGKDPKIDRTVAIKTMSFSQEFEPEVSEEIKQRFHREATTAGRLNHNNIVTIYDVGEEQDLSYIAMDYLEGVPMSEFTKPKKLLPVETVLDLVRQVAEALHYAHEKNVVHRDIKPENIIFDQKDGKPTVTDFGVACLTDASKTKTGVVLGSPSYMSPEQLAGKRVDGRSDLFSLGVTLYQLLCGELPFQAESLSSLMYKIATEKHLDIRKVRSDLPACTSTITNKCLQKDPENRYVDGKQLAESLKRCRGKLLDEK